MPQIHALLLDVAAWKLAHEQEKVAFVPSGGDPAAGGAPPGDPAAAGGMPPGDPAAAGGAPAGGGVPPFDPSMLTPMIQQAVQQAMQGAGGGMGAQSPTGPAGVGQKMKIDPTMVYLQLGRMNKLMIHLFEQMGWPVPPDTLNDDAMIQQAAGQGGPGAGMPGATGGAPSPGGAPAPGGAPPPAPGGDPAAQEPQGLPGIGQSPAINPIQPAKTASIYDLFRGGNVHDAVSAAELLLN